MVSHPEPRPVSVLFDIIEGPIRFHLVDWAFRAGVFDLCATAASANDVAQAKGLDPRQVMIALRGLTALGLLQFAEGTFQLAERAAPYLCRASDRCLAATFASLAEIRHRSIDKLEEVLTVGADTGQNQFDSDHWRRAQASLQAFHNAVAEDHMLPCLSGLPEWPEARRFLDLGAGSVVLADRITKAKPEVAVTVFDLPQTIVQIERQAPAKAPMLAPGNYADPASLPEGPFDVIWASMSLYFHHGDLVCLIGDIAARLAPGGALVSFHEDLDSNRTAPREHVLGRLMPALSGHDVSFAGGEVSDAMAAAGLTGITSEQRETPFGRYRLDVGRAG